MRKSTYKSFFTLLAFWIVATAVQAADVVTEIKDGAKVYIRYNVNAGTDNEPEYRYLNAGNAWGTRAIIANHATECVLEKRDATAENTFYVHVGVANGGGTNETEKYLSWDQKKNQTYKCDQNKGEDSQFLFEKIRDNVYKIYLASRGTYISYENVGLGQVIERSVDDEDPYTEWEVVTKDQLIKELGNATTSKDIDATFFISDPGFGRNVYYAKKNQWKIINTTTNETVAMSNGCNVRVNSSKNTYVAHKVNEDLHGDKTNVTLACLYVKSPDGQPYKVQQELTGLPSGKYRIRAKGFANKDNACYLFVGDGDSEIASVPFKKYDDDAAPNDLAVYSSFQQSKYRERLEVEVVDGTLVIGVENKSASSNYAYFDDIELYYLGPTSEFTPAAVANTQWREVTSASTDILNHPENYIFTIWQNETTLLSLADGTDGMQGTAYSTMSFVDGVKAIDNNSYLWDIYKTTSGKYVFSNATYREGLVRTEENGESYFRFSKTIKTQTYYNTITSKASTTLVPAANNTWNINSLQGYLRRWSETAKDIKVDATDITKGYFKLYAIPRIQYAVTDPYNSLMESLSDSLSGVSGKFDASLAIANPSAVGQNTEKVGYGWNNVGNVENCCYVGSGDGHSIFLFKGGANRKLSQTLHGMPKGRYTLTAGVFNRSKGATGVMTLYIGDVQASSDATGVITVTKDFFSDNNDIEIGAFINSSNTGNINLDNFTLTYSVIGLNEMEEFYIRKNVGTVDYPEYHYISGGTTSTDMIMAKHGTSFTLEKGTTASWGGQFYKLHTNTYSSGTTVGYLGSNLTCNSASAMEIYFRPVTKYVNPFAYYMSNGSKDISGTLNNKLTLDGGAMDFEVVNKEQLVRELSKASPYYPVDATFLIDDPNFSKSNTKKSSWKVSDGSTNYDLGESQIKFKDANNVETWVDNQGSANKYMRTVVLTGSTTTFTIQQTLSGLPKGYYRLSAQGIGRKTATNMGSGVSLYLFAKNGDGTETKDAFDEDDLFVSSATASDIEPFFSSNNYENYKKTIEVFVGDDGILTIGVKNGGKGNVASFFDNFELYYIGEKSSQETVEQKYNDSPVFFNVNAMENMVEVKTQTDAPWLNPEDYFFTIWKDNKTCLALAKGTEGKQGTSYKTMSVVSNPDLLGDKSCLWEFVKTADGKYVMINMSDRDNMMQTEDTPDYFRYNASTALNIDKASVTFESAKYNNWAVNTPQGYLTAWDNTSADVKVGSTVGYYKIYAIPRRYYVIERPKVKYYATNVSPKDMSLLLVNPEGVGTSEDKTGILAWNASTEGKFWTLQGNSETFRAVSGKSFFNFVGENSSTQYTLSQTVKGLLAGNYKLRINTYGATSGTLYVKNLSTNETTSVSLKPTVTDEDNVEVEFELASDNTNISIGVQCTGKTPVKFDKFSLKYYGVTDPIVEPLVAGEDYYIRTNIGTASQPEYRYLESGGLLWGTAAVFGKHGMEYKLEDANSTTTVSGVTYPLYYVNSGIHNLGNNNYHLGKTGTEFYNDLSAQKWYFISRNNNTTYPFQYKMTYVGDKKCITYEAGANNKESNVISDDTNSNYVEIVPKHQRLREFVNATMDKPVDATFLIKDYGFGRYDTRISAWKYGKNDEDTLVLSNDALTVGNITYKIGGYGQNSCDYNFMASISNASGVESFDVYQVITDVPNGHYQIYANGVSNKEGGLKMYVSNGNVILEQTIFKVYANEGLTNSDVYDLFAGDVAGTYRNVIDVDVADGKMVIGFTGNVPNSKSFFDNIEMYYCGVINTSLTASEPKNFTPKSMVSPWIEVKSASDPNSKTVLDNSDDYLFAIWSDATHCLTLAQGTDGCQGSAYQTVSYTVTECPWDNLQQMWEFYREDDGKYVLVNASAREWLLQSDENSSFFRFNDDTNQKLNKAVISIIESDKYNNWRIASAYSNREFKRWGDAYNDIKMAPTSYGDYYKIYAIKRVDYYTEKQNILYNASALARMDVSLLLKNPEALGEIDGKKHIGWTFENANNTNVAQELAVADTTESKFSALNGKTYYEYRGNAQPTTQMFQTITGLPRGIYLLSVLTTCAGTGAKIKAIGSDTEEQNEELSHADPKSHIVYVPVYLQNDGGSIKLGIDLSGYQHKRNNEESNDDANVAYIVKFDHFVLQYMGVSATLASPLANGTYYIRTNLNEGTDKEPEYRYLDAGGDAWGTDPLLGLHGMSFYLNQRTDGAYSLKSEENQANGEHGPYFDGAHFDHAYKYSIFNFVQIDPEKNPLKYTIFAKNAAFSDGDKAAYSSYKKLANKGYVYLSSDGSTLDVDPDMSGEAAVWEIVTKNQRVKELQNASANNPMDATFFIMDPSFGRNNVNKTYWCFNSDNNTLPETLGNNQSGSNSASLDGGNTNISIGVEDGNSNGNRYDFNVKVTGLKSSSYNLYQKVDIDNLPAGRYRLSVHGYTNVANGAVLYAKDENSDLGSLALTTSLAGKDYVSNQAMAAYLFTNNRTVAIQNGTFGSKVKNNQLVGYFRDDLYYQSIEIKVTSNTLIVGVRGTLNKDDYAIFDNFELYYLGEDAEDITQITEPVERYLYNVDAGLYLNKSDDTNEYCYVTSVGEKYVLAPVSGTSDKYYIYTENIDGTKYYLKPNGDLTVRYVSAIKKNKTPYQWTISPLPDNKHMFTIKDDKGQIFEWTGDAGNVVFMGYEKDKEPRGTRWALYEPGQYQKDRVFATIASATRSDGWRYMRSARVNMSNYPETSALALTGLKDAYDKLDDVWSSPMSSIEVLTERIKELKGVLIDAMSSRGTVKNPIDVSFFIQNAGLGNNTGWTGSGSWRQSSTGVTTKFSNDELGNPYVHQFLYDGSINKELTQTIKNIPAGKYKLAIDFTTRADKGSFKLFMKTVGTGAYIKEFSNVGASSYFVSTFTTDDYIELDKSQDLVIGISRSNGAVSIDNFKLYFNGNVNGKLKFNADNTEVTMLGDWDDEERLYSKAKDILHEHLDKLGAMHIYKENVLLENGVNVTNVGWQKGDDDTNNIGNNILFYTDFAKDEKAMDGTSKAVDGNANIVRKGASDSYSCDNLVITDKMTMHVPYEFTASTVSYSRANPISTGTLCLPFDLTKTPEGLSAFYIPEKIDWEADPTYGRLKLTKYDSGVDVVLPAHTPVFYNGTTGATINFTESNALIHKTSELPAPNPTEDDLTMYGTYKKVYVVGVEGVTDHYGEKNADGLSADECYYVRSTDKLVRGKQWFNAGAFRAFVYRGKDNTPPDNSARSSVLYIDFDDLFNGVEELKVEDAVIVGYYDAKGVHYDKPQKGLNVILYSDGSRRKVYVK